jgi:hypothetical protein
MRLDELIEKMHDGLSDSLKVNTRNNPQSRLNVWLVNFSDRVAELWETAQEIYNAMYPSSAEDVSLDHACEFGGSVRADDRRTYYPIACTGLDGTELPIGGIRLASDTVPQVSLINFSPGVISLAACNWIKVRLAGSALSPSAYSITINGIVYRPPETAEETEISILEGLQGAVFSSDAITSCEVVEGRLIIQTNRWDNPLNVVLSSTLTTTEINSTVNFGTEDFGDYALPHGTITNISRGVTGLNAVANQMPRIAGSRRQTDEELRLSYAERIFIRSRTMLESINSAVLTVQGVRSCKSFQNDTHVWVLHRPPHSVEAVVDGEFDDHEVAKQILGSKAAGIQSCHCRGLDKNDPYSNPGQDIDTSVYPLDRAVEVVVLGENNEDITVRFSRPIDLICDIVVAVSLSNEPLAVNAFDLIRDTIRAELATQKPGQDVRPQMWLDDLFRNVSGVADFDIRISAGVLQNVRFVTGLGYNFRAVAGSVSVVEAG